MNEGTRVQYKAAWLRSIGVHPTDKLCFREGEVLGNKLVGGNRYLWVLWDDEDEPQTVRPACLKEKDKTEVPK